MASDNKLGTVGIVRGPHPGEGLWPARGGNAMRSVTCILAAALSLAASAASAADFYQGKQVTIVVGFSAAGTYDATARLFARHLGKYLPGKPTVIVRNMPGAGSLVATNSLYSSLPKDGTTLGVIGGGVVLEPLTRRRPTTRGSSTGSAGGRACAWSGTRSRCERCRTSRHAKSRSARPGRARAR